MLARNDIIHALGRVELFRILGTAEDLESLADAVRLRRLREGECLYRKGEEGEAFFVVFTGTIHLLGSNGSGGDVLLRTLHADEAFGDEILLEGGRREAEARASTAAAVLEISRDDFSSMVQRKGDKRPWVDAYVTHRALQTMIHRFEIVSDLEPEDARRWLGEMTFVNYKQGDVVFRKGDAGRDFYIVVRGEVGVYSGDTSDPTTRIRSLSPGEHFGELALLGQCTRTATVAALQDCVLGTVTAESFQAVFAASEALRNRLLAAIASYEGELPPRVGSLKSGEQGVDLGGPFRDGELPAVRELPEPKADPALRRRAERPPRGFRFVAESEAVDRGLAACLSMVAGICGLRLSLGRVRRLVGEGGGRNPFATLERAAPRLGLAVNFFKADVKRLSGAPLPAIVPWEDGRLAVIFAANPRGLWLADPAAGVRPLPPAEFEKGWKSGLLAVFEPTSAFLKLEAEPSKFQRYTPLLRRQSRPLLRALGCALIVSLLALVPPLITGLIVDRIVARHQAWLLPWILFAIVAVALSKAILTLGRELSLLALKRGVGTELMSGFMRHLFHLPLSFFARIQLGELFGRIRESENIRDMLSDTVVSTVLDLITVTVLAGAMFLIQPALALVTLACLPVYVGITLLSIPYLNRCNRALFQAQANEQGAMVESLVGLATVKSVAAENTVFSRWRSYFDETQNQTRRTSLVRTAFASANEIMAALSTLLMFWFGTRLVLRGGGHFGVGQLVTFVQWSMLVYPPIERIVGLFSRFQAFSIGVDRLNMVLDTPPEEMQPPPAAPSLPAGSWELKVENLSFSYVEDQPCILSDLSFEASSGQMVAVVGRSGSGKTTLINLLMRFYDPGAGRILLNGTDIRQFGLNDYRNQVGVVLQENFLFTGSVRDNLTIGNPNATAEEIEEAITLAAADGFIRRLPKGQDTIITERGRNLSGGQRQRLAIARALLRRPRMLIFDEATSALDNESERAIQRNMQSIGRNRIMVVIAHRLSTIRNADLILVVDQGRIVERGRHHDLLEANGLYSHLLRMSLS
ncbi:MAG: peptidase domain-containing ABC transporter [Verrucomicrobia bacterium]|nr:peptidase domain-containing ABC transporter [Verrucomicrobiota bacterium]